MGRRRKAPAATIPEEHAEETGKRRLAFGSNDDLIYVSPKTGRAVSASAGEPYKDKLLRLPGYLAEARRGGVTEADLRDGLELTAHFLTERVPRPREAPEPRVRLAEVLGR